jgi:AraC-like DNA-binding protein
VLPLVQDEVPTMHSIFSDLYDEFSETSVFSDDICRLHLKIILLKSRRLLHETIDRSKVDVSAATHLAQRFNDILEEEITKRKKGNHLRTPSEYAEKLCVHTNYLNASVKKVTGKTTQAIIKDRVLQEAQILLKYTQSTTSEIADELGFKETTHFCSFFKKMATVTPLQYRKMNPAMHREGVH